MSNEMQSPTYLRTLYREEQTELATGKLSEDVKQLAELQHQANELSFQQSVIQRQIETLQNERIIPALKEQRDTTGQEASSYVDADGTKFTVKLDKKIRGSISYETALEACQIVERIKGKKYGWEITVKGDYDTLKELAENGFDAKGKPAIQWNTLSSAIKEGIKEGALSNEDMDVLKVSIEDELKVKES